MRAQREGSGEGAGAWLRREEEGAMRRILGQKNGRLLGFEGMEWSLWMLGVREGLIKDSAALELVLLIK